MMSPLGRYHTNQGTAPSPSPGTMHFQFIISKSEIISSDFLRSINYRHQQRPKDLLSIVNHIS